MEGEDRRGRLRDAERLLEEAEAQGTREVETHDATTAALRHEAARVEEEARVQGEQAEQCAAAAADAERLYAEAAALASQADRSEGEGTRLEAAVERAEAGVEAKSREAARLEERCRALDAENARQGLDAAAAQQELGRDLDALEQLRARVAVGYAVASATRVRTPTRYWSPVTLTPPFLRRRQDDARAEAVAQALRMAAV